MAVPTRPVGSRVRADSADRCGRQGGLAFPAPVSDPDVGNVYARFAGPGPTLDRPVDRPALTSGRRAQPPGCRPGRSYSSPGDRRSRPVRGGVGAKKEERDQVGIAPSVVRDVADEVLASSGPNGPAHLLAPDERRVSDDRVEPPVRPPRTPPGTRAPSGTVSADRVARGAARQEHSESRLMLASSRRSMSSLPSPDRAPRRCARRAARRSVARVSIVLRCAPRARRRRQGPRRR